MASNSINKNDVLIRELKADDYEQWSSLWKKYLEFYKTVLPDEVYQSTFGRMLLNSEDEFHGLVAVVNGELVGIAHYLFHKTGWSIEKTCYLQDLYVSENVRGLGIGKSLIATVYAKADDFVCRTSTAKKSHVYWMTQESNVTARKLYDQVGEKSEFLVYERKV